MLEAQSRPHLVTQVVPAPPAGCDATIQRLLSEGYLGGLLAVEVLDGVHSWTVRRPCTGGGLSRAAITP
jgi:hypothetical protein